MLHQKSTVIKRYILHYRQKAIFFVQFLFVIVGYILAFSLRFDLQIPEDQLSILFKTLPLLLICRLSSYYLFKLNTGWWRFVSMVDLINITRAITLGSILFLSGLVFIFGLEGYPRSIVIIEAILNFGFLGGSRFGVRWFRESIDNSKPKNITYVLVVGAGKTGTQLLNELRINPQLGKDVVGFVDDDAMKRNAYIQGSKVLGNCKDIPKLVKKYKIDEIIITIPCAGLKTVSAIVRIGKECGVKTRVLPSISDLIHNDGLWRQLKDVPYDALMDRPLTKFRRESDLELLKNEIEGKTVLITGAGGSIGSELCRQSAKLKPKLLVLYERDETSLYYLELELRKRFPECQILPVIGDILNIRKLHHIIACYRVNLIYHAAAYKHVPMMEREPIEAVRNNIFATKAVVDAALKFKVDKCVYISTDKAVNPCNIMGATKRVGEMVMQAYSGKDSKFITVRFGNVIGSNGSVIPLFKKQITQGGPVTVTHNEVTRYFMTISEAVQLVMTAGAIGKGGEIFLLDMGKPVRITDLANKLIKSSGLTPEEDIEIKYIGLRPGEKLHEELFWKGENIIATKNKKITMLQTNGLDGKLFISKLNQLKEMEYEKSNEVILETLKHLVPEGRLNSENNFMNNDMEPFSQVSTPVKNVIMAEQ